jgi:septal ring factor EnvC (AmiA/AmiB activator)
MSCRICFDDGGKLCSPCNCKGSMELVHRGCLAPGEISCKICLTPYKLETPDELSQAIDDLSKQLEEVQSKRMVANQEMSLLGWEMRRQMIEMNKKRHKISHEIQCYYAETKRIDKLLQNKRKLLDNLRAPPIKRRQPPPQPRLREREQSFCLIS